MRKNKKINLLILFFSFYFLFSAQAFAAESPKVYFHSNASQFSVGSHIVVDVFLDGTSPMNALQLAIRYPQDILELLYINETDSVINIFKELNGETLGMVILEGASTKPFQGESQKLIELNFRAKEAGRAILGIDVANIYYADGFGTKVLARVNETTIDIVYGDGPSGLSGLETDVTPPIILNARIIKSPLEDVLILAFEARDERSGVKKTEARIFTPFSMSPWDRVVSPMRVPDGAWFARLRATDNAGNISRATTVFVWQNIVGHPIVRFIFVLLLTVAILLFLLRKRFTKISSERTINE